VEQPLPAERYRRIGELPRERQVVRVSTLSEPFSEIGVEVVTAGELVAAGAAGG
jgi:hypothetical protein